MATGSIPLGRTSRTEKSIQAMVRTKVEIKVGATFLLPYSVEVSAGEPSQWQSVHKKYHDQNCTLVEIRSHPRRESSEDPALNLIRRHAPNLTMKMKFEDGFVWETHSFDSFIFIKNPD